MTTKQAIWAVVPAAGSGSRIGSETPKQYLQLGDEAMLAITIKKLLGIERVMGVVVALSEGDEYWKQLGFEGNPRVHKTVGGATRSESVMKALQYLNHLEEHDSENIELWACVHDAARPCVSAESVERLIAHCTSRKRGAILGVPIADTVKRVENNFDAEQDLGIEKTESREFLWQAHTPQMFLVSELMPALDYCELDGLRVTDEASAIENVHGKADLVLDRRDNIKVTLPEDLPLAEFILQQQKIEQKKG